MGWKINSSKALPLIKSQSCPRSTSPPNSTNTYPPERNNFFNNFEIRFSQLSSFNDPFDGNPNITRILSLEEEQAIAIETLKKINHNDILKSFIETHPQFENELTLNTIDHMQSDLQNIALDLIRKESHKTFHKQMDKALGALCLTETPDSPLMWAHYAQDHTGFVIELDGHNDFFHDIGSTKQVRRVIYIEKRPSGTLSDLNPIDLFFTKSIHWIHEKEWRMLERLSNAVEIISKNDQSIYLFNIPPDAIKSIIFGCRCNTSFIKETIIKIQSKPELSNASIKYAQADNIHYQINIHADNLRPVVR